MNQITRIILRSMPMFFFVGVIFTTIMALLPSPQVPGVLQFWDKAQHFLAYTVLSVTGSLAFPKKLALVSLGLMIHGALVEIMQLTLTTTRSGEVLDWLADGIGILTGIVACTAFSYVCGRGHS